MGSIILKFLVGGIAGLLAWAIMEPSHPAISSPNWAVWESSLMIALGSLVGAAIGGLDGFTRGGNRHTLTGLGYGLLFGAIGATLGHGVGGMLVQVLFPANVLLAGNIVQQMIARTLAFIPIGLFLGAGIGLSSLSFKKAIQGAIGGALGAATSGLTFDIIGQVTSNAQLAARGITHGEVGGPSRAIATMLMGAAIGLFIGLVDRLARSAWLRLSLGRNEGKEWSLDLAQNFIGRSESAQVPLFGDQNVAPIHASILRQGNRYIIQDGGSAAGTLLNGQFVQQAELAPGSVIQVGSFALTFMVKGIAAPARPIDGMVRPQPQPAPVFGGQPVSNPMPTQAAVFNQTQVLSPSASMPTQAFVAPMAAPVAAVSVIALDGPLAGQRIPVTAPLEMGWEATGVRLASDGAASRRHAQISPLPGGVHVIDLGSTNGTFVNGQQIQSAQAMIGDVFRVGSTNFRVEAN